jgi:hypothetical protein
MTEEIEIGFQAYVSDGGEEFGAVRAIGDHRGELIIYVENAGDFAVRSTRWNRFIRVRSFSTAPS